MFAYLITMLAAVAAGIDRGLPGVEARSMDRAVLVALSLGGVAMAAIDGLPSRASIERVLRWMVLLGAIGSAVGIVQFALRVDPTTFVRLPGLSNSSEVPELRERGLGDFVRVRGVSRHPIEHGVLLATLLPIALHLRSDRATGRRLPLWVVAIIACGIPLSISRSAVLALFVGMAVFAIGWTWAERINAACIATAGALAFHLVSPGLLGTIRSLFLNVGRDDSISGRTQDYGSAADFIAERPWFGRGPGTFVPEEYFVLDNEYLDTLLDSGWLGLGSLVGLLLTSAGTAWWVFRRSPTPGTRSLALALLAGVAIALVVFATFDALFFPLYSGTLAVIIGCIGALFRLEKYESVSDSALARSSGRVEPLPERS